jgi:hypothetical protein
MIAKLTEREKLYKGVSYEPMTLTRVYKATPAHACKYVTEGVLLTLS